MFATEIFFSISSNCWSTRTKACKCGTHLKQQKEQNNSQVYHQLLAILESRGLHLCPVGEKINKKQCLTIQQRDTVCLYAHAKRYIYVLPVALLLQSQEAPVVLEAHHLLWSPMNRKHLVSLFQTKWGTFACNNNLRFHFSSLCYLFPCRPNRSSQSYGSRRSLHMHTHRLDQDLSI